MPSKFNPETRAVVVGGVASGLTLEDAARAAGISHQTLKGWIGRGRKEDSSDYSDFEQAVSEARSSALPEPLTEDEHRRLVSAVARKGSVQALKLYWEMIRVDRHPDEDQEVEPGSAEALDELAQRRIAS